MFKMSDGNITPMHKICENTGFHWLVFYPSIKECLLRNAINFTEQHTEISEKDRGVIFHARKSLLFNEQHIWIKKEGYFM